MLTDDLAGFDPSAINPDSNHGEAQPCSNLQTTQQGTVNVSDSTVKRCSYPQTYRPLPGDLSFSISNPGIYKIPVLGASRINPSIQRVVVPLSYQSQYATLITSLQGAVGFSRSFFHDKFSIGYSFGATKYFDRSNSPVAQASAPPLTGFAANNYGANSAEVTQNNAAFYASDANVSSLGFNSSYSFSHVFSIGYNPIKRLSFSLLYILSDSFSYGAPCGVQDIEGVSTNPCANANTVAGGKGTTSVDIHDSQIFWLSANYQFTSWVGVSLAWVNASPLRTAANITYQPFISTNYDAYTNITLGATFSLGHDEED